MSEAKAMKLREYGTNVISHDLSYSNEALSPQIVRNTNTFKSKVYEQQEKTYTQFGYRTASQVHTTSKERLFRDRPNTAKIQRTSYQDSNIFGYKEQEDITV